MLNNLNTKLYSRKTYLGAVFAERLIKSFEAILKRPVSERGNANWIDLLPMKTKYYINRKHSSTELKPTEASLKKKEGYVFQQLLDRREKIKPKYKLGDLVRAADLKKASSDWSYKLYKITKGIFDTKPSYKIDQLSER